jgi:hypothetical protein
VAFPLLSSAAEPSEEEPSRKLTVPLGVPFPEAELTATDKVIVCPKLLGFTELVSEVVLPLLFTVCVTDCEFDG